MIFRRSALPFTASLAFLASATASDARAQGLFARRHAAPVAAYRTQPTVRYAQPMTTYARPTARYVPVAATGLNPGGGLGTFTPTPYLMVRGNAPAGGGYSPLGAFGDATLAIYGPLSPFRPITAPVTTYARGYDGRPVLVPGTASSTPNEPSMTNVVFPTQSTNYFGFRQSGSPPWFANGINWIDQN